MAHTRTYLTCELNNRVAVDRLHARSFEQWRFHFEPSKRVVYIESQRSGKLLGTFRDGRTLATLKDTQDDPDLVWIMYAVPHCHSDVECYGQKPSTNVPLHLRQREAFEVPLFGSPKPIGGADAIVPSFAHVPGTPPSHNLRDITLRTWRCWSAIPHVTPVVFTKDENTIYAAKTINGLRVDIDFEEKAIYKQPTYRGLFRRAFDMFPNASVVVYSNSDILYTRSLVETIHAVAEYFDRRVQEGIAWKGWMVIGQRMNVDVPATFDIDAGGHWERKLQEYEQASEPFQNDAEDYFAVSRGLFEWSTLPDFVVGGVAFDNWIVAKANRMALRDTALVVDASKTVTAIHQNHGLDVKLSHQHPKSEYNRNLAERHGGWSGGKTGDASCSTERQPDGRISVFDKHRLLYR